MADRMKTVLYLDHAPFLGGAQAVLLNVVARLDRTRFHPLVGCPARSSLARRLAELEVEVIPIPLGKLNRLHPASLRNLLEARRALARILSEQPVDILHSNTVRAHIVGSLTPRPANLALFWTLHDFTFPRAMCFWLSSRVQRVLAVSGVVRDYYQSSCRSRQGLVLLYNGVELPDLPLGGGLRRELGLSQGTPVVGCVGRLVRWKGQDVLLRAAALVVREMPEVYFLLVGEPDPEESSGLEPFSRSLQELAEELGLADRVIFTGFRSDMGAVYATLSMAVHPTREAEPFGLAVAEAMASGIAVVAVNLGGPRELIENGVSGMLVPPEDARSLGGAILELLTDRERAAQLGRAGRQRVEGMFDLKRQVRRLEELYEQALADRKGMAGSF